MSCTVPQGILVHVFINANSPHSAAQPSSFSHCFQVCGEGGGVEVFLLLAAGVVPRHRMYWRQRNLPLTKLTACQPKEVVSSVSGVAMTSSSERTAIKASKRATAADTAMTIILIGHTMVSRKVGRARDRMIKPGKSEKLKKTKNVAKIGPKIKIA